MHPAWWSQRAKAVGPRFYQIPETCHVIYKCFHERCDAPGVKRSPDDGSLALPLADLWAAIKTGKLQKLDWRRTGHMVRPC